jgi:hypothetical protein
MSYVLQAPVLMVATIAMLEASLMQQLPQFLRPFMQQAGPHKVSNTCAFPALSGLLPSSIKLKQSDFVLRRLSCGDVPSLACHWAREFVTEQHPANQLTSCMRTSVTANQHCSVKMAQRTPCVTLPP